MHQFALSAVDTADAHNQLLGNGTRGTGGAVVGNLVFTLEQARVIKGRDEACVLVLRDSTVPGQEEVLEVRNCLWLMIVFSTHGTYYGIPTPLNTAFMYA